MQLDNATVRELKKEAARLDLFSFCQLMYPKFYLESRSYLKDITHTLQEFIDNSPKRFLVLTCPPRHGKSLTAQALTAWLFGRDPTLKVMTGSYNERLSTLFARSVRNLIQTEKVDDNIVYSDIFSGTKVKYGEASASMWSLEGNSQVSYLATSPSGTATGMGANVLIIDDVIKNAAEAYNENTLDGHWEWFTNTMIQRLEGDYKVIVIMTRWSTSDLAGRILEAFGDKVEHIEYAAVQPDGSMLCDDILSAEDYKIKTAEMNVDIAEANYNQKPIDVKGRLYSEFKLWDRLPVNEATLNFTDTADTGEDYLCSINGVVHDSEFYITDLVFTDKPMEVTEPAVADLLHRGGVQTARIESNNGGRGFARNVERILKEQYRTNRTVIEAVPQTHNKESRILASSAWVQNHIYMPLNWQTKYPDFYKQVISYQRRGKNKHDDAVDVLASIYESVTSERRPEVIDKRGSRLRTMGYWS